jgi:hypothetical protein
MHIPVPHHEDFMPIRATIVLCIGLFYAFCAFGQDRFVVKGKIADIQTKVPVPSVNVFIRGQKIGTVTDTLGRFELAVPSNREIVIVFSHIAYRKTTRVVLLDKPQELDFKIFLEPDTLQLQELVIWGLKPITISESAKRRALFTIGESEFERMGESDMDKALQHLLPHQVKPLVKRMTKPEDDFTLYVNGEWKESLFLRDINPFTVRRVMVWEMLGPEKNIDVLGRDAGSGKTIDVFPIGMPLRRGSYVISIETKN